MNGTYRQNIADGMASEMPVCTGGAGRDGCLPDVGGRLA